ncbi:MAG: hypothetical protein ACKO1N_06680 [Erythrobacter sp.]
MSTLLSTDPAIERIALGVIDRTLPKGDWTHEAQFAAALWLLRNHSKLTRPAAIRALITGYNEATKTPNTDSSGYHHTITLASMKAARHHLASYPAEAPLHAVLSSLMMSELGKSDWLLAHWSRDVLFSVAARRRWVEPDISPLPF